MTEKKKVTPRKRKPAAKKVAKPKSGNKSRRDPSPYADREGYTPQREAYVQAYLQQPNKRSAYRAAYNASKMKPNTVGREALEVSKHPYVTTRLEEEYKELAKKNGINKERIMNEYARIGFSDIRNVVAWSAHKVTKNKDGETVIEGGVEVVPSEDIDGDAAAAIAEVSETKEGLLKVKLYDKKAALDSMSKILGMMGDDPTVNITVTVSDKMRRAIARKKGKGSEDEKAEADAT